MGKGLFIAAFLCVMTSACTVGRTDCSVDHFTLKSRQDRYIQIWDAVAARSKVFHTKVRSLYEHAPAMSSSACMEKAAALRPLMEPTYDAHQRVMDQARDVHLLLLASALGPTPSDDALDALDASLDTMSTAADQLNDMELNVTRGIAGMYGCFTTP